MIASRWPDNAPDPERWLQAMDVFCLPSYANEGVPQAILQAMLGAPPIVTTPVGSTRSRERRRDGTGSTAKGCHRAGAAAIS
ncbi:MAG: glycosyltransferase [Sulfuritalea sp.]|nr:glycosyltransferase [Sulfuritalea sp.]